MSKGKDPDAALDELLRALDVAPPAAEQAPPPAAEPAAASPAPEPKAAPPDPLVPALLQKMQELQAQLLAERGRATAAEVRGQSQDEVRREVDDQLRRSLEAVRQAQGEAHSRGRIEALESRFDEVLKRILEAAERPQREAQAGQERLFGRLEEALGKLAEAVERPRGPSQEAQAAAEKRLGRLLERLEVLSLRHEREFEDMSKLKAELHLLAEKIERRRGAAVETLAALDAQALKALERVTVAAEAMERGLGGARLAAAEAREALAGLGPRGAGLEHAAELLERQRRLEERLEEALRQLAEKDRLLSRLTESFRRIGGTP